MVCYAYDRLGRLVGVVDPQGRTAIYEYDAVGNILAIRRQDGTGPVAVTFLNPNNAGAGSEIQLLGIGFSATPAQNQVSFGGAAATVVQATRCSLTVGVPNGAVSGPITVTTPLGTAQSLEPFTAVVAAGAITVSPADSAQLVGTSVTYTAMVTGLGDSRVSWSVDGIEGGNATRGLITPEGRYGAPSVVPTPATVRIRATSLRFPEVFGEATVTIVAEPTRFAEDAVSVRAGPPPLGTVAAPALSVLFGPPPPGSVLSAPVSVALGVAPALVLADVVSVANAPVIRAVSPGLAAPGSAVSVTVSGVNFGGATTLRFLFQGRLDADMMASNVTVNAAGDEVAATVTTGASASEGRRVVVIDGVAGASTSADTGVNTFAVATP